MQWGKTKIRDVNWLSNRIKNSQSHQERIWDQGLNDLTIVARTSGRSIVAQSGEAYIDFMSCSYLGLERHPALSDAVKSSVEIWCAICSCANACEMYII